VHRHGLDLLGCAATRASSPSETAQPRPSPPGGSGVTAKRSPRPLREYCRAGDQSAKLVDEGEAVGGSGCPPLSPSSGLHSGPWAPAERPSSSAFRGPPSPPRRAEPRTLRSPPGSILNKLGRS